MWYWLRAYSIYELDEVGSILGEDHGWTWRNGIAGEDEVLEWGCKQVYTKTYCCQSMLTVLLWKTGLG